MKDVPKFKAFGMLRPPKWHAVFKVLTQNILYLKRGTASGYRTQLMAKISPGTR